MQVNEQVNIYYYIQPNIWDKSKLILLINLFWTIWKKNWHVFHLPHIVIIYWSYLSWTSMKPIMNIIIHKKTLLFRFHLQQYWWQLKDKPTHRSDVRFCIGYLFYEPSLSKCKNLLNFNPNQTNLSSLTLPWGIYLP